MMFLKFINRSPRNSTSTHALCLLPTFLFTGRISQSTPFLPSSTSPWPFHRHLTHSCSFTKLKAWSHSYKRCNLCNVNHRDYLKKNYRSSFRDLMLYILPSVVVQNSPQRDGPSKIHCAQITPLRNPGQGTDTDTGRKEKLEERRVRKRHGNIETFFG